MNKASQVSVERKLNVTFQQLWTLISWMQDWTLDEVLQFADVTHKTLKPLQKQAAKNFVEHPKKMTECYEKARKTFCLYRFPACITYKSNSIASIRKEFLCREACLKLKQDICAEAYTLLSVFDQDIVQMYALDCNVLPSVLPKRNSSRCIQPAFLIPGNGLIIFMLVSIFVMRYFSHIHIRNYNTCYIYVLLYFLITLQHYNTTGTGPQGARDNDYHVAIT